MADIRKVAKNFIKIQKSAIERLEHLDEVELNRTLADLIQYHVGLHDNYTTDTAGVLILVCAFLSITVHTSNHNDAVSAMIDAGDGEIDYTRSGRLLTSVQSTQRAQAEALASHDFRKEWAASTKAPIDFLGNCLG